MESFSQKCGLLRHKREVHTRTNNTRSQALTSGGSMTQLQATDTNTAQKASPKTLTILDTESLRSQIKITNVAYTCEVGCKLDIETLVESGSNTKYVKVQTLEFALMKIDHPKATAKIFKTGKLNVTGAQSPELARESGLEFTRIIQRMGYNNAKFLNFKVTNIGASVNMGSCIDIRTLHGLLSKRDGDVIYSEEDHPSHLTYVLPKTGKNNPVVHITVNGVVWCIGFILQADIYPAFETLYPDIRSAFQL